MAVDLDTHQIDAVRKMHNGSVLKGGVGTGKSRTALAYVYLKELNGELKINGKGEDKEPAKPKAIYIFTTAKKRDSKDWEQEAVQFAISSDPEASVGKVKLVVASWNQIADFVDVKDSVVIFDEQRLVGRGAWVKAFYKLAKNNRWILLSATPGDNWLDYIPIFVANGFVKNRTEFVENYVIFDNYSKFPKVKGYRHVGRLEQFRDRLLVEMPYHRHTKRMPETLVVGFDEERFKKVWVDRWNVFDEVPVKDVSDMFRLARKVVNSDPSRLAAVMQLLEKHPKLIVWYSFNYELEMLRTLGKTLGIESKEYNGSKHEELPTGNKWLYLVQYTAGSEGWNAITTDAMAFYSLPYSYKVFEQAHGRIDRMNTPYTNLYYYTLRSGSKIDLSIWKALRQKQNFSERKVVSKWDS